MRSVNFGRLTALRFRLPNQPFNLAQFEFEPILCSDKRRRRRGGKREDEHGRQPKYRLIISPTSASVPRALQQERVKHRHQTERTPRVQKSSTAHPPTFRVLAELQEIVALAVVSTPSSSSR